MAQYGYIRDVVVASPTALYVPRSVLIENVAVDNVQTGRVHSERLIEGPDMGGAPTDPADSVCASGATKGCGDNCPAVFNPEGCRPQQMLSLMIAPKRGESGLLGLEGLLPLMLSRAGWPRASIELRTMRVCKSDRAK